MAGLKAVFLKKLSITAYAMGRYAITRRKTRAGAVVPRIHARRSVVALIAGPSPVLSRNTVSRLYHVRGESEVMGRRGRWRASHSPSRDYDGARTAWAAGALFFSKNATAARLILQAVT